MFVQQICLRIEQIRPPAVESIARVRFVAFALAILFHTEDHDSGYAQVQAQAVPYTCGPRTATHGVNLATITGILGGLGICFGGFAIYRDQRRLNRECARRVTR